MKSSFAALFILIAASFASLSFSSLTEYFAALMLYYWQCWHWHSLVVLFWVGVWYAPIHEMLTACSGQTAGANC